MRVADACGVSTRHWKKLVTFRYTTSLRYMRSLHWKNLVTFRYITSLRYMRSLRNCARVALKITAETCCPLVSLPFKSYNMYWYIAGRI